MFRREHLSWRSTPGFAVAGDPGWQARQGEQRAAFKRLVLHILDSAHAWLAHHCIQGRPAAPTSQQTIEDLNRELGNLLTWVQGQAAPTEAEAANARDAKCEAKQPRATSDHEAKAGRAEEVARAKKLPLSRAKAYAQWQDAVRQNVALDGASDRKVYDWVAEHLEDGEKLPLFESWTRYLTEARTAHGTNKHTSRARRKTSRNIVRPEEI
jgi:hypothetical protein